MIRDEQFFREQAREVLESGVSPKEAWVNAGLNEDEYEALSDWARNTFGMELGGWLLVGTVIGTLLHDKHVQEQA